ncbi:MAG: TrkH family potassium uptake protein [Spirochaetaceae bacterium]
MRKNENLSTILNMLGTLTLVMGGLLLLPIFFAIGIKEYSLIDSFLISSGIALIVGAILRFSFKHYRIDFKGSMLICGLAWVQLCIFAALPFFFETGKSFLDCYFETVSGFTTTGITIYTNIESLDKTIILWRSFTQWLGGLGIITFFLAIAANSGSGFSHLLSAESHKIDSARLTPSVKKTAMILWGVYIGISIFQIITLKLLGMSFFDSVNHTMTALSTGGFSPYDSSINHFRLAGYKNYKQIEYALTFFMFLGGMNFVLHFKFLKGHFKEFFTNRELQTYFLIVLVTTLLIIANIFFRSINPNSLDPEESFRRSIFTVVSILTTTGFGTEDINSLYFPAFAKQVFLLLMVVGGCIGSTAGGIKVQRVIILWRLFLRQIKRLRLPRTALSYVKYQGVLVSLDELQRIAGLFTGWLIFLAFGGFITAFFTDLSGWAAFSGMFSAMGNIGPCFFSVDTMSNLPAVVKITYIIGMLAGRLEILPILLIFSRRAWR